MPGWWVLPWSSSTADRADILVELRAGEQRLRAVWEVLDGASVTEVARRSRGVAAERARVIAALYRRSDVGGAGARCTTAPLPDC